jgi:GAF domain-containing protein/ActR/RegA family two-component response regulator
MSRVLILDDDMLFCRTLRDGLLLTRDLDVNDVDLANTAERATQRMIRAMDARVPYDIMLVDQYLGNNTDGIQVMADLRRISPSTDAIVFTGMGDPGSGQRAYTFGAARYLQKPFEIDELILIMGSLKEWRQVQHERTWMQSLIQINEAAEKQQEFSEVARVIVEGSLGLGFDRAVLFWIPERQPSHHLEMVGMCMAGRDTIPDFPGRRFRVDESPYVLAAQSSRDVLYFYKRSEGEGVIEKYFGSEHFPAPVGEWACLPLWANERFSGILMLDYADREMTLSDDQRKLLQLYDRQVTAILERARLFGRVLHNRKEIQRINQIGKQITVHIDEVDMLLEETRAQIGERFNVENFFIALVNEETQRLEFRLHYEGGRRRPQHTRNLQAGLCGHIITSQMRQPLYLADGSQLYCERMGIRPYGNPAKCWLGIPLWVVNRPIGVMVIQSYSQPYLYSPDDINLLDAVADQIAGAIYVARIVERDQERLNLLQRASAELVRLLNEKEEWMWRALLNIISANYGLKFNRAWLFLSEAEGTRLAGVLGVGHLDRAAAQRDWKRDLRQKKTFDRFLEQLRSGELLITPLEQATLELEFSVSDEEEDVFYRVLRQGQRICLSEDDAARMLPAAFTGRFNPGGCAVVPFRAGDSIIGLVIVDNRHNGEPVEDEALDRLETFLNMAGLVYLNERRRGAQQALLNATHVVARQNEKVHLGDTLSQLCEAARLVTNADWVIVYPLRESGPDEFDVRNIGRSGVLLSPPKQVKSKPRQRGVSAYILRTGRLVIDDIHADQRIVDGDPLEQHSFIQREGIRAFIGLPVLDQLTGVPLGVMYIDYHKSQCFSDEDLQRAETFSNLAGVAIRNARSAALGQSSQRELNILQQVLKGALSNPDEGVVIRTLLNGMRELLQSATVICRVILAHWETLVEGDAPVLVLRSFVSGADIAVVEDQLEYREHDWVQKVIEGESLDLLEENTRVLMPIRTGIRCLGVLDVRDPNEQIDPKRQRTLERIAAIAALALDNARRQSNLVSALKGVKAFTGPSGLTDTLKAIVEQIRVVSPDISALTIWYMDMRSGTVKLGPTFGVRYSERMLPDSQPEGSVVKTVMDSRETIWAEDALKEKRLGNQFVYREGIYSVAAFPLITEGESVGAMFFNYRHAHHFTLEERSLFSLLTEIVAASIRDASQLEDRQRESERLELTLRITDAIGTSLDQNQVIDKALTRLHGIMSYLQTSLCLLLYQENDRVLEFVPVSMKFYPVDNPEELNRRFLLLNERAIAARVARQSLREKRIIDLIVDDVSIDSDYRKMIHNTRSELAVSLVGSDKLLGVLVLESPIPGVFEQEEIRLVVGVAQQISLAIERIQQINRLQFKETVATATAWATEIAHDINREIGRIRDQVYWIKQSLNDPERILQSLERIGQSASKLSSVGPLGNMADKPLDVNQDIRTWVDSFILNSEAPVDTVFELCSEEVIIETNTVGLQRVMRHLVRNAIQSMNDGGMLTIRTIHSPEEYLEIQVEDTGPGISAEVQPLIFQQPVTTKEGRGGFGLLLVRQIVEGMGGAIWARPQEPARGAVFCIRLPLRHL